MEIKLLDKQKEWLEYIVNTEDGIWLYDIGFDWDIVSRVRDILERGSYTMGDKEILNEMREVWLTGVTMRI